MRRPALFTVCLVLAAGAILAAAIGPDFAQSPQPEPSGPGISFDVVVVDRDGQAPDRLAPGDVTVSVDGKPRRVVAVRRISRGPGAVSDAASRMARAAGAAGFAAEPIRSILVVVDQPSLVRGDERATIAASRALLDHLGVADRLAVVLLPFEREQILSLTTEQPDARQALGRMAGRLDPVIIAKPELPALPPVSNAPVGEAQRDQPVEPPPPPPPPLARNAELYGDRDVLGGLTELLQALRDVPGRKVVALFSAGVANPMPLRLNEMVLRAIEARTAISVFAMPGPRGEAGFDLQLGPLETLARSTGGVFLSPGRNADRVASRAAMELAACFVVELERAPGDGDGRRHALRVEAAGRGLTVRAPAWLVPTADPGDLPAALPTSAAGPRGAETTRPARPSEPPSGRDAELQTAMGRLVDYVEAYERQYSGLVAEEEYVQSSRGKNVRLRSDFLLVKPEHTNIWVSFRDVFEVDGVAVRDRDDRLRRLFLDPGVDIGSRLQAIRTESARYNVGAVERNINVPLFLLQILAPENRPRFRFRLTGTRRVAGVEAWRIEFDERARPTVISNIQGGDVVAKGWFLVDQITGAIVETCLKVDENGGTGEIVVSFRHDDALGMWVPVKMTETYQAMALRSGWGMPRVDSLADGTATYSNFRRFQVKIEEKVVIPK